jgi:magnesium-transporting ATPase (P-type)
MATLYPGSNGGQVAFLKGAPEVVLGFCSRGSDGEPLDAKRVSEVIDLLAALGMRVLAIASWQPSERRDWMPAPGNTPATLLGLVGFVDPPRPESAGAISRCHDAGVQVKMVTGDHRETALAVGKEIGLVNGRSRAVNGKALKRLKRAGLDRAASEIDVFARVEPADKLRLVQTLQAKGEVVAMTGDGVNDAPALKQADIGVAMGKGGTATARQAADVVLLDDNFASITAAVEEGRRCYENLVKSLLFLLPTDIGQALVIVVGVFFFPIVDGKPLLPLIPLQVLWINLVTGVTLAFPLAYEPAAPDLMSRLPRRRDEPILNFEVGLRTVLVGAAIATGGIGTFLSEYYLFASAGEALRRAQTVVATTVVLFQVIYVFQCRSLRGRTPARHWFNNPSMWAGVALTLAFQLAFVYVPIMNTIFQSAPLTAREWAVSAATALLVIPVVAIHKKLAARSAASQEA